MDQICVCTVGRTVSVSSAAALVSVYTTGSSTTVRNVAAHRYADTVDRKKFAEAHRCVSMGGRGADALGVADRASAITDA